MDANEIELYLVGRPASEQPNMLDNENYHLTFCPGIGFVWGKYFGTAGWVSIQTGEEISPTIWYNRYEPKNKRVSQIRTYVAASQEDRPKVAIGAMREEELINHLMRYDITEREAEEVLERLVQTDPTKYRKI